MIAFFSIDLLIKHWRAAAIVGGVLALLGFGAHERLKGYQQGKTSAITKIEKANDEEMRRATSAAKTVDDCYSAGGDWDRELGLCKPPATSK